ncbi:MULTISPECIES: DUF5988 family protein [Streptomyces]|uniref:Uncharacterized protein n=1 Tax=Streptomyces marianii TaxID=1817406 RepID=A0A5R9E531_9ACTN|nr:MULTISPECIES: DUF5988 family protein [Streptomyces]MCZ7459406.1 DUF5988 family protein [Streptomyces sp. WMMC940]MDI9886812.1 DUF5988 family protein [Streptomyces sp. HNM0645]TLQ45068.1 hypothetical protein FEF34_20250 [Streptomyces marianii]
MASKARLEGGPDDLRGQVVPITPPGQELKIPHRGGYEHFKATTRHEDAPEGRLTVYEWWERTEVAE